MPDSRIGVRYAKALFSLAEEKGVTEPVRTDLIYLLTLIAEVPELSQMLSSPLLSGTRKSRIVGDLLKEEVHPMTLNFLDLLIGKKRESDLQDACRMFNRLCKERMGIVEATIVSVVPLNKNLTEKLKKWLSDQLGASVELTHQVNGDLIGGFIMKLDDRQLDASVRTYLQKIRNELRQVLN